MIRPFQLGDVVLVQRLGRQATKLNAIQSLLQPYSPLWASLLSILPRSDARVTTYILRQQGHELARAGFLQAQKRPGRAESDIHLLAPGLDSRFGHPAIWEKLLSYYVNEALLQDIARVYVDVPDQPLPVNSFMHVGFKVYARQTIWRMVPHRTVHYTRTVRALIRPAGKGDEWALQQLYARVRPKAVQQAEGVLDDGALKPPILAWWHPGACRSYVLESRGEVEGCIQLATGLHGVWLQLWAHTLRPDTEPIHQMLRFALNMVQQKSVRQSVYIGVDEFDGGLGAILSEYGFAPFTDRAKMVKPVLQWVREPAVERAVVLDAVPEAITAPYILPD